MYIYGEVVVFRSSFVTLSHGNGRDCGHRCQLRGSVCAHIAPFVEHKSTAKELQKTCERVQPFRLTVT